MNFQETYLVAFLGATETTYKNVVEVTQVFLQCIGTITILHCESFFTALAVLTGYRQTCIGSSRIPRRTRATKNSGNFLMQNKFIVVAMHNHCNILVYT